MLRKGIVISVLIGLIGVAFAAAASGAPGSGGDIFTLIGAVIGLPAGLAFIVFGIWTIVYIYRMQQAVTHESEAASANWAWEQRVRQAPIGAPPLVTPASAQSMNREP